jgi:ribokinase
MPHNPRNVVVVGSSNTDLVVICDHLPRPGETVLGGDLQMFGGGKGANQAVAAARAGANVTFVGAHGADSYGAAAHERLAKEGIETKYFQCLPNATSGVALIFIDSQSRENMIAVARSANELVDSVIVSSARDAFETADVVISQLEIRDGAIEAVARLCHEQRKPFVLNPAPARVLPKTIYESLHTIVVNEHEAATLSGETDIRKAITWFHRQGCRQVVVTLGAEGITISDGENIDHFPARKVKAVDTTGAGDCFVGWLGASIAEGLPLRNAAQRAGVAASIKITRAGAQPGMPYRKEVDELESLS